MAPVKRPKANKNKVKSKNDEVDDIQVVSGQLKKKIQKQRKRQQNKRGVVFIKHLPHGFFEQQLENYFNQFGNVTRIRLARSRRTGGSKGFAFIEFEYPEVAQVAAETMDNYLMFRKLVKATYIPPEKQRFNYFKSTVRKVTNKAGKEIFVSQKTAAITKQAKKHNDWSEENYQKRTSRKLQQLEKLKKKYAHLGIDFSKIVVQPQVADNNSVENAKTSKQKKTANTKKNKKNIELADLLGSTINDDSEDEDYVALNNTSVNESSEEENYVAKDSEDEEKVDSKFKTSRTKQSLKVPKVDSYEKLLKRKPNLGGIKKTTKKAIQKPPVNKQKNILTVAAAMEIAKPLNKMVGSVNAKAKNKKQKA